MTVDILDIRARLDKLEEELIAKVPEHLFINHLLPLIAGDEGHTDLNVWNHLAGSIFNRIAVVDPAGETLFTLPQICSSPITPTERDPRNSVYEIMLGFENRVRVSPVLGRQYLDRALANQIEIPEHDFETLKKIDEILVRYGRKPHLPANFTRASGASQETDAESDEDVVGDDL